MIQGLQAAHQNIKIEHNHFQGEQFQIISPVTKKQLINRSTYESEIKAELVGQKGNMSRKLIAVPYKPNQSDMTIDSQNSIKYNRSTEQNRYPTF